MNNLAKGIVDDTAVLAGGTGTLTLSYEITIDSFYPTALLVQICNMKSNQARFKLRIYLTARLVCWSKDRNDFNNTIPLRRQTLPLECASVPDDGVVDAVGRSFVVLVGCNDNSAVRVTVGVPPSLETSSLMVRS